MSLAEAEFIGPRHPDDIPLCLVLTPAERKKCWEGVKLTVQHTGETQEVWQAREQARRELIAAEIKAKNAAGLARMKEKHAGERYDRKLKMWVKIEGATDAVEK